MLVTVQSRGRSTFDLRFRSKGGSLATCTVESVIRAWSPDKCPVAHLNHHSWQVSNVDPFEGSRVASFEAIAIPRDPIPDGDTALAPLPEYDRRRLKFVHRPPLPADVRGLVDEDVRIAATAMAVSQVSGVKIGGGHDSLLGLSSLILRDFYNASNIRSPKKRSRSLLVTDSLPNYEIANPQRRHDPLLVPNIYSTTC